MAQKNDFAVFVNVRPNRPGNAVNIGLLINKRNGFHIVSGKADIAHRIVSEIGGQLPR
jgi:hypothetical protein